MIRTKPLAESSRGASQRTAWVVMFFFIAGYALGGLQKLFGGSICYSLDVSQALDASGQHAAGHQVHAGGVHAGTCICICTTDCREPALHAFLHCKRATVTSIMINVSPDPNDTHVPPSCTMYMARLSLYTCRRTTSCRLVPV